MYFRIPRMVATVTRCEHVGIQVRRFWEQDRKSGYPRVAAKSSSEKRNDLWHIRNGFRILGDEFKLFKREVIEHLESDPLLIYRKDEIDLAWRFNGDKKSLDQWFVTADSDYEEGYSNCSLQLTKSGRGLFSGYLDKRVPKTGNIKKAGYCNINTLRARKSFKREGYYDWHPYNHLVMRVRGDGRSYMLNISTAGYFDITWNDVYHYALYTRGGPYWQYVKIPFSKFFMASKGRIQDHQEPLPLHNVVSFGITAADKVTGPFNLEIDYIGLLFDPSHKEECAYEMYKTDDYIAGY
ncbi:complex I intermediate-associated protein 30, mitochondrial [Neodiprion pinetum]|uniref:Complex I intermediate-associated protein 30, mitochondrial n=1 Tax=Neodiprion lecontei TaxID=441921 RepID=A0A6J0BUZ9_NEOLC|nr:complex I intermediate-associated protein 30, mitochondrial [Neodiprion lecontei]XP_046492372.1 complex I intermediate-associated protein 30, mitochondrial [Neodiprion pinetum]